MVEICPNIHDQRFEKVENRKNDPRIFGADPSGKLESEEFWDVFKGCVDKLPGKQGRVFFLREIDEESSEQICDALSITASNLWVLLHRIRLRLARCLKVNWDANLGAGDHA